jgi:DNA-binding transcriptional MerR regulator
MRVWKIGELAKQTGITVRTLHHWDEIGLVSPTERTPKGYRLYTADDIARLQRVVSLRQLGFSLDEIRSLLDRPDGALPHVLRMHAQRLREEIGRKQALCDRLESLVRLVDTTGEVSVEEFLKSIQEITTMEKYFTPGQRAQLEERAQTVGAERVQQVTEEWPVLIAEVRAEMERGTAPTDPKIQQLAQRWMSLVREFSGGDIGLEKSVMQMYRNEPSARERSGIDPAMFDYIGKACAPSKT